MTVLYTRIYFFLYLSSGHYKRNVTSFELSNVGSLSKNLEVFSLATYGINLFMET